MRFILIKKEISPPFLNIEHHTLRLFDIIPKILTSEKQLKLKLGKCINDLNLKVLNTNSNKFKGGGYTITYVLSQSSMTAHSWPEYKALHVDILTCSRIKNKNLIQKTFSNHFETQTLEYKGA